MNRWVTLLFVIAFWGGIQLLGIGIIGECTRKIYMESKHKPRYIVAEKTENFN